MSKKNDADIGRVETMKRWKSASCEFDTLDVADLQVDSGSYQRALQKRLVGSIRDDFVPAGLGVLTVGRREDGSLWVVDGQTRAAAMKELLKHGDANTIRRVQCLEGGTE